MDSFVQVNLHFSQELQWFRGGHGFISSPNRACLYGVLATNLLISWGLHVWPRGEDVVVFSQTAVPLTLSIRHFSESCCGCSETHNYVLRHRRPSSLGPQNVAVAPARLKMRNCAIALRPLWSSKSFKNNKFYKHSWSVWFLSWSFNIHFSSKTIGFISFFGVSFFLSVRLIFAILHIS